MLLLIDNYDSFTYNLYQYLCELGAEVRVVRNDKTTARRDRGAGAGAHRHLAGAVHPASEAGITVEVIRHFAGRRADPGRLPGAPVHRRGLRRGRGRRRRDHARQDVD